MKYQDYDGERGITVECKENMRIKDVFAHLEIDENDVGMVLVNRKIIKNMDTEVHEHDVIHLFSAVPSGG
jgi:sulfur carrier protein ThiS